jgi:protein-tyrosine-phosphatase
MATLAFGYFAFYAPYSALASSLARGLLPGLGRPASGLALLPAAALGTVVGMAAFLGLSGWWRHARREGPGHPSLRREILAASFFHALIIGATTLNYTFAGVSILFVLLLMRGGVLILSPIVDALRGRAVQRASWTALALSLGAVALALSDVDHYDLSLGAALSLSAYFVGYIGRFLIMERAAKSLDLAANRRYYVEEQMASSPLLLTLLGAATLLPGGASMELRAGFTTFLATPTALPAILVGVLYAGLSVFGSMIYVDRREYTYCVPVNRGASLFAGVVASYALSFLFALAPPSPKQLAAAGLVFVALAVLARPSLAAEKLARGGGAPGRRLLLFVCGGNTCRSPMAEAIARAELAERFGVRSPARALCAGLAVRAGTPMTRDAQVALRELGVEPGPHRARPLTPELLERAEVVFCMTAAQREAVLRMLPGAADKAVCLDPDGDVPDPIGSPTAVYLRCARRLRELIRVRLDELLAGA